MLTCEKLPCGFDPDACPSVKKQARAAVEPDSAGLLMSHFQEPGTAIVFAPTGSGGKALAAGLREAGVEVHEISWNTHPDPEAARVLAQRLVVARANGERIAVFASSVGDLRRWSESDSRVEFVGGRPALRHVEGGWLALRDLIDAGSSALCARLVMALGIADRETARLFGLKGPMRGHAVVLV